MRAKRYDEPAGDASMTGYDVIVAGGGPAGSVSSMLLARAGHSVMLLERRHFPRAKPCGDCLSPAANRILKRIGVWDDVLRAQPAWLRGWQLTAPGGAAFSVDFAEVTDDAEVSRSIALRRDLFDAVLLTHAQAAGVHVLHGASVNELRRNSQGAVVGVSARVNGEPSEFRARVTIGADGLRSIVARRLAAYARAPRLRKTSFTVHTTLDGRANVGEMRLAQNACLGIAPVTGAPGGSHNVTLVLPHGSFNARMGAKRIFTDGIKRFGLELHVNGDRILTSGPFDWPVRHVVFDGAALVGDAAGYYDPFTGQGIYQALAGAELLAGAVDRALRAGIATRAALAPYHNAHLRMTAAARRLQRVVEFVCARPRLADLAFRRFANNRPAARALIGATGDLIPADSLFTARFLMGLLT